MVCVWENRDIVHAALDLQGKIAATELSVLVKITYLAFVLKI